jgi:tetraacyldisaccharide 4'-kinase
VKFLLFLISFPYRWVVAIRNFGYDKKIFKSQRFPIPVVSVGNLTAGGTGKTPTVDWICKFYQSLGKKVAIVSRGYKRQSSGLVLVSDGNVTFVSAADAGDEPLMLARRNPVAIVVVAAKRAEAVQFILDRFKTALPDVVILDDGFQHRQLHRNLDVVIINSESDVFTEKFLPLGKRREPTENLRRADAIVLSKVTKFSLADVIKQKVLRLDATKLVASSRIVINGFCSFATGEPIPAETFLQTWGFAFSGIGEPQNFLDTLEYTGLIIDHYKNFPDHHAYTAADIDFILDQTVRHQINVIITTEKDYYRLKADETLFAKLKNAPCFYLTIEFQVFEGEAELSKKLKSVLPL